jgi:hypothetical protein
MYAELLDPSPGGLVGVGEGHIWRWRAIVPSNIREPSKEVSVPRRGDVDRPHRLASTCHTRFPEGNQMHLICAPGSSSTHMIDEMSVIS